MDKYNVLAGLYDNRHSHIMAYKEEVVDNKYGMYYKAEDVEPLQLELVETREQNDRLQQRCEELEEENERLKTFIAYHKLDRLYDLLNSPETEGQRQEFLRMHGAESR